MNAHFFDKDSLEIVHPEDFVSLVSSVADIAVVTDRAGKIRDVIWNIETRTDFDGKSLIGLDMTALVTRESRVKISEMLADESAPGDRRYREVNHDIAGLDEFPVRYKAVTAGDLVIFLGQEIRAIAALQSRLVEAQRALDEDYGRLRQLETQYRVLFQTSAEALLVVDAETGKIDDANAAVGQLLARDVAEIKGHPLSGLFTGAAATPLREAIHAVLTTGQPESVRATLKETPAEVDCNISVFRAANVTMMLCSLTMTHRAGGEPAVEDLLLGMIARIPDAMVLTDQSGAVRWCNDAFLGMAEVALAQQAEGEPLARFLGRPGVDIEIIIANALEHGRLRAFSSVLTGVYGSETRVEISAAALPDLRPPMIGFVMRDITRYDQIPARKPDAAPEGTNELMNLVGSVPLKELVRASTEEIEKMCIETALRKTGNNRASAAELLGLSRQSLYVKLRRFGLVDRDTD